LDSAVTLCPTGFVKLPVMESVQALRKPPLFAGGTLFATRKKFKSSWAFVAGGKSLSLTTQK